MHALRAINPSVARVAIRLANTLSCWHQLYAAHGNLLPGPVVSLCLSPSAVGVLVINSHHFCFLISILMVGRRYIQNGWAVTTQAPNKGLASQLKKILMQSATKVNGESLPSRHIHTCSPPASRLYPLQHKHVKGRISSRTRNQSSPCFKAAWLMCRSINQEWTAQHRSSLSAGAPETHDREHRRIQLRLW
jgi:hypothetical protein